jgi:hypothetical protein
VKFSIRLLYLYLFSFVGLIVSVIGTIRLVDLGLKVYLFKDADKYEYASPAIVSPEGVKVSTEEAKKAEMEQKAINERESNRNRQREAAGAIAMLVVGLPLYKYHWGVIQKENRDYKAKEK